MKQGRGKKKHRQQLSADCKNVIVAAPSYKQWLPTQNTVRSATDSLLCPGPDLPSDYKPPLMKLQVIIRRYFNKTRTQHFKCRLQETFKFITGLYQPFTQGL